MKTVTEQPVFENIGLSELEKAWKKYGHSPLDILLRITEENFEKGELAVALFLADKILKEKKPSEDAVSRLRFIRAEGYYAFKFYRQAYPDYKYYVSKHGKSTELENKMRYARKMIHTGNIGTLLFIGVFELSLVIMFLALYQLKDNFPMGLNLDYIYYAGAVGIGMILFGLFYRYVIIARMK